MRATNAALSARVEAMAVATSPSSVPSHMSLLNELELSVASSGSSGAESDFGGGAAFHRSTRR